MGAARPLRGRADPARAARHRGRRGAPPRSARDPRFRPVAAERALGRGAQLRRARRRPNLSPWRPTPHGRRGSCARGRSASRGSPSRSGLASARARCSLYVRTRQLGVGFWIDEGLSVGIADRPLLDIPGVLRQDGSPPLYYVLLEPVAAAGRALGGGHPRAVAALRRALRARSRGGAAGCCSAPRTGWMAAVLAAANPFLTQYAQETRMYALRDPARARGAGVLAARVRGRPAGATAACAAARGARLRGRPSRRCSTPTTGPSSSASRPARPGSLLLALAPPRRTPRGCCARRCRPTAARCCSTSRGCRRSSTRPPTRARRGRTPPDLADLAVGPRPPARGDGRDRARARRRRGAGRHPRGRGAARASRGRRAW